MLDEAQAYEDSRNYDCCQIINGAFTVGCAVNEAYCEGRSAPPADVEVEAVAKRLLWRSWWSWDGIESDYVAKDEDDAWDYAGEICGYREDFIDRAKEVLEVERHAVTE